MWDQITGSTRLPGQGEGIKPTLGGQQPETTLGSGLPNLSGEEASESGRRCRNQVVPTKDCWKTLGGDQIAYLISIQC